MMKVRENAGLKYRAKTHSELSASDKKKDTNKDGKLDKGSTVLCKEIKKTSNGNIWIRSTSGWLLGYNNSKEKIHIE